MLNYQRVPCFIVDPSAYQLVQGTGDYEEASSNSPTCVHGVGPKKSSWRSGDKMGTMMAGWLT